MSSAGDKSNGFHSGKPNSESVAKHYNKLEEIGLHKRTETNIYYLRNFNNWVKSCLISTSVDSIKEDREQKPKEENTPNSGSDVNNDASGPSPKAAKIDNASNIQILNLDEVANEDHDDYSHPSLEGPPGTNHVQSRKRNSFHMVEKRERLSKRDKFGEFRVLDLCCGKGGDLLKWSKCEIPVTALVGFDIADVSIKQCRDRFRDMKNKKNRAHNTSFVCQFHALDCAKNLIRPLLKNEFKGFPQGDETWFDLVSCQFSIHYSFESQRQAEVMVQNACEMVHVGGYFIGTTLNSREVLRRLRRNQKKDCSTKSFGNQYYGITFEDVPGDFHFPTFGAKYNFQLDGVVDCPEFLCDLDVLTSLVAKYGFELKDSFDFKEAFERYNKKFRSLLEIINALEPYIPDEMKKATGDYKHAETFFHGKYNVGTLSQSEWEAISIYHCFVFKRVSENALDDNFVHEPQKVLKSVEESLDDDRVLQPPLIDNYRPRKLVYKK